MRWIACVSGLALLLAAAGCGGGGQGEVSGQVLYRGKPLPGGLVTFRPADGRHSPETRELDRDGRFKVTLPVGKVAVIVDNRELAPVPRITGGPNVPLSADLKKKLGGGKAAPAARADDEPPRPSGRYVPIPEKYHMAEQSGLDFTVVRGPQTHDLKLTD